MEEYGVGDFSSRIEDAHASGLRVASEVGGVKALQEDGLDWAIVQVAVEYGEYTGRMEKWSLRCGRSSPWNWTTWMANG